MKNAVNNAYKVINTDVLELLPPPPHFLANSTVLHSSPSQQHKCYSYELLFTSSVLHLSISYLRGQLNAHEFF